MKVALLWNGVGDPAPELQKAEDTVDFAYLLTFIPEKWATPLALIKRRSEKLGIPFFWARVNAPYLKAFRETVSELKEDFGIEGIVIGKSSETGIFPEIWIQDACKAAGVQIIRHQP